MCEPATLAAISIGTTVASTGLGAMSAIQQGRYQSQVARNNAAFAEWQKKDALDRGDIAEQQQRKQTRQLIGSQRAAMGASGLDMASGSMLDLQMDAAALGELDALTIRSNAEREAYGLDVQAGQFRAEAKAAKQAGYLGAATTLLGGAASVSGQIADYRKAGVLKQKPKIKMKPVY